MMRVTQPPAPTMNPSAPSAGATPALKLSRRVVPAATSSGAASEFSTEMSGQLAADLEALRERETNLRDYEARLRAWQAQLDAATQKAPSGGTNAPFLRPSSAAPFANDATLEAAWEKFYRARGLLEAEQKQMRDERIALRDMELSLKRREAELAQREAALAQREQMLVAAEEARKAPSAVQRLTQAPFLAAKAVFGSGK